MLLSISTREHMPVASRAILSIFFGEQGRQNHPQYLSGLSRALFPTTFLETAVYAHALTRYILAGKRDNRCCSATDFSEHVVATETSYQM